MVDGSTPKSARKEGKRGDKRKVREDEEVVTPSKPARVTTAVSLMPLEHPQVWQWIPASTKAERSGCKWILVVPLQMMTEVQVERWLRDTGVKFSYFASVPMSPYPAFVALGEVSSMGALPGLALDGARERGDRSQQR